jgi:Recombinase
MNQTMQTSHPGRVAEVLPSSQKRRALAVEQMSDVAEVAIPMRGQGRTLAEIATHLNDNEYLTRNGAWTPTQVKQLIDRAAKVKESS